MRKKQEEWITSKEAAAILTANSEHEVSDAYVRQLGINGKLTTKPIDARTKVFLKSDVEEYTVRARGTGEVRRAARAKRGTSAAAPASV